MDHAVEDDVREVPIVSELQAITSDARASAPLKGD
jgi:hypothetical protein